MTIMYSDLISRAELLKVLNQTKNALDIPNATMRRLMLDWMIDIVSVAPAVGAVEVVRCKDCVKRDQAFRCIALYYGFNPHDDWFCAEGERDNAEVEDART